MATKVEARAATLVTATSQPTSDAREIEIMFARERDRVRVSRVRVPHHAGTRIRREDAPELLTSEVGPVRDGDHAGVDRVPDPDAAAVMHGYPRRAGGGVHERVQDRPVGDGVAAV